jgi:nucleoside-diphosphate-sugar epimerase
MDRAARGVAGRRVIVTGAAGFLGGHVMAALSQAGAFPIGLVKNPAHLQKGDGITFARADLVHDSLDPLLRSMQAEVVIHCAGRTFAADTDEGRQQLFADNVTATARLISAAARMPRPLRLVIVSSAAIWAPMPDSLTAIDESHAMRPVATYGVSKAAATLHALAEAERLGLDMAVGVPFNVIGPGQPPRLVPQVFIKKLRADPETFALNATSVRDWVDVRDVAEALVSLSQPGGPQGLFNIASGIGVDLKDMLSALCRVGNWHPVICEGAQQAASGVSRSIGNPQRLIAATGWSPRFRLEDSLRDMIFPTAIRGK